MNAAIQVQVALAVRMRRRHAARLTVPSIVMTGAPSTCLTFANVLALSTGFVVRIYASENLKKGLLTYKTAPIPPNRDCDSITYAAGRSGNRLPRRPTPSRRWEALLRR